MSATVPAATAATWANIGSSGAWTDPTQWTPASVPGGTNNVAIGGATVTTAAAWTVSVAGTEAANSLALGMGAAGTLAVTGALSVTGAATVGYASGDGVTIDVGAGASFGASSLIATGSTFQVNGGTITTGAFGDLGASSAYLQDGGAWNADALFIGNFSTALASLGGTGSTGTITASGSINVGSDGTPAHPFSEGFGTLDVTGGSFVAAPDMNVVNNSVVNVDSLSAIDLGSGTTTAGAVDIGAGGTLGLEWANIHANVVDNGMLMAQVNTGAASSSIGPGPVISGTLSGTGSVLVGSGYTIEAANAAGFSGSVTIDPNATLRLDAGAAPTGAISMAGGTLDLRGLTFGTGQALAYSGNTLTVGADTLNVGAGLSLARFSAAGDASTGTMIVETPCYAAGTRIAGADGEVAVETLRPGDQVRTASGRLAPVRWVGQTTLDVGAQPHAAPVRIAASAFAPGLPRRPLLVSGDHAIAVGGALIPARHLVNGATIRQEPMAGAITYVHVELDRHDLLLAEGLAAESFLDTGNRGQFAADAPPPRFDADPEATVLRIFAEQGCAPLVLRGPLVAAARARLRARAEAQGWHMVADPAVRIEADRPDVQVAPDGPEALQVVLPAGTRQLRLLSRRFVPAVLDPTIADGRQLGAALAVELDGVPLDGPAFGAGWYGADAGVAWRWTDGAATLLLPGLARPAVLTVHLMAAGARYWVQSDLAAQAA